MVAARRTTVDRAGRAAFLGVVVMVVMVALVVMAPGRPAGASTAPAVPPDHLHLQAQIPVPGLSPDPVLGEPGGSLMVVPTDTGVAEVDLATQKVVWTTQLPGLASGGEKVVTVTGGLVLTAPPTSTGDSTLEALDPTTGQTRWTLPGFIPPESPPNAVAVDDAVVTLGAQGIEGLDPSTGEVRWSSESSDPTQISDFPIATDGQRLFVGTSTGSSVVAYHAGRPQRLWQSRNHGGMLAALAVGDHVVVAVVDAPKPSAPSTVYAYDTATGHQLWSARLPAPWDFVNQPAVVGNTVIVTANSGTSEWIMAYKLGRGGVAWKAHDGDATVAVAPGRVYASTTTGLMVYGSATGKVLSKTSEPLAASGPVYVVGSRLAIIGDDQVYVYGSSNAVTAAERQPGSRVAIGS
jgi:outer membrane protein assembly factor BamB